MSLTALAFLGAYGLGLLSSFIVHPRWGLITYIAVFYLHPPLRWWGVGLPDIRWSLVAAVVTLISLPQAKLPPHATPFTSITLAKLLMVYVAWMWIQTAWASPLHLEGVILYTKYLVLFYLIYRLIIDEKTLLLFAIAHVLGCFYFGLLALDARGVGRLEYIGGPGANDSNTLGMHVSTGLFFAGTLILTQRRWIRWAVLLMVPVLANCIVQTESRGAFLGAAFGGLAFFYLAPKLYRKYIFTLGIISIFILLAYAPAVYWERMGTLSAVQSEEVEIDRSSQSRLALVTEQLNMFADYPFGLGFDTTTHLSRSYLDNQWLSISRGSDGEIITGRSSHNTLLSVLVDQGIPGIIMALAMILVVLSLIRKFKKLDDQGLSRELGLYRAAIGATLAAVLTSGMFTNYLKAEIQLWSLALLVAVYELGKLRCAEKQAQAGTARDNPVPQASHLAPSR
ncbi:MAG: O-antigen ligase family protein [Proteobacteria bacterium]|nr:O-antigen ligase family protein [Pseudomonadota bacterium]